MQCNRKLINAKVIYKALKSPFSEEDCRAYADAVVAWRKALDAIEECVKRFNDSVNKRTKLYKQIRTENSLLARKQHSALLRSYKQAKENSDKIVSFGFQKQRA